MKSGIDYIKEAWSIYTKKENFIFFARIMAVISILSFVLGFINGYFFPSDYLNNIDFSNIPLFVGFMISSIITLVVNIWTQTTTYMAILKVGKNEKDIFILGYKNMWRMFLISFVVGLMIVLGLILLIIPALIFGIWYSFSAFLVLDKKMGIKEALTKSKAMVKGKFFKILGRYVIFGLFSFIASIILMAIPYVGSLLTAFMVPLFILPGYLMYKDLVANN